jgi:hypothetical protein
VLQRHAEARLGRRRPARDDAEPPPSGELLHWDLTTRLVSGDTAAVLDALKKELGTAGSMVSYETEWRLSALAAAAGRRLKAADTAQFTQRAQQALDRLRNSWKEHAGQYERRPDVQQLSREAGLNSPF